MVGWVFNFKSYEMEEWKTIRESDNYEISNLGRFRNSNGRILKLHINSRGYLICNISVNAKVSKVKIHRLVAQAFIDNESETVNHINGDKLNNNVDNLEWMTAFENKQHYHKYLKTKVNQYL